MFVCNFACRITCVKSKPNKVSELENDGGNAVQQLFVINERWVSETALHITYADKNERITQIKGEN